MAEQKPDLLADKANGIKPASALMGEVVKANKNAATGQNQSGIPKFDLADDIMAEHRRATAMKRAGPAKKTQSQKQDSGAERMDLTIGYPEAAELEKEQIITEIVARDIERLYHGRVLNV